MRRLKPEVLIVGAGPAGLASAIGLARHGIDFIIVDALPEAQNTSRAAVIHAATLETLDELGVADTLVSQGIQVPHFRIRDRDDVLLHADFSQLPGPRKYALMIPQDESERILIERLRDADHEVMRPTRFLSLRREADGIRAECADAEGILEIEARLLIGADGERSAVRGQAGVAFPGATYGSFMLADVRMEWPIEREEVSLFFSDDGLLVVAPMSKSRYRVVAQLQDAPASPSVANVQQVIDSRGPRSGAIVRELLWGSRFRVHHKIADRFQDGRVFLVGDAAHVHSPAGGQGMNLGLRDAWALAEAIAGALRHGDGHALDTYAEERRRAAAKVLRMTDRLTEVATLPNPAMRSLRNRVISMAARLPAVRRRVAHTLAGFG